MTVNWRERFLEQGKWTKPLRDHLFNQQEFNSASYVLEIGSGTGAIIGDLSLHNPALCFGLDKDITRLSEGKPVYPGVMFLSGDVDFLPFSSNTFDCVFCHYLLLWLSHPEIALAEVFRVLKPGGVFLALAEPDYLARVDAPDALVKLGKLQNTALTNQGVRLGGGRMLPGYLNAQGFMNVSYGVTSFQHHVSIIPDWWDSEWSVIEDDLKNLVSREKLIEYKEIDRKSWLSGERVLWIPTFYASGAKLK